MASDEPVLEGQSADLEYDLAHEVSDAKIAPDPVTEPAAPPEFPDPRWHGGDYSYDLAHDVPGR